MLMLSINKSEADPSSASLRKQILATVHVHTKVEAAKEHGQPPSGETEEQTRVTVE